MVLWARWPSVRAAASWQSSCWAAPTSARPGVVAIYLTGALPAGCGPHDVAIALVGKLFQSGYVKNKVMEFVGPGIASLRQDTRNAIDAMTTETTCLSSIWETDETTRRFLAAHGREKDYKPLAPQSWPITMVWSRWICPVSAP